MENAHAQCATEVPSVAVIEEVMQDQQIVGDSHVTIVSSAYVYQTAIILTDEEIALHSTGPLCSVEIIHLPSSGISLLFSSLLNIHSNLMRTCQL